MCAVLVVSSELIYALFAILLEDKLYPLLPPDTCLAQELAAFKPCFLCSFLRDLPFLYQLLGGTSLLLFLSFILLPLLHSSHTFLRFHYISLYSLLTLFDCQLESLHSWCKHIPR